MKYRPAFRLSGLAVVLALSVFINLTSFADYPATVLSQEPVGYWRLNETAQPPAPVPAANQGSLGPEGDGYYLLGPKLGEPGALAGSSGTSTRFFNPDLDVTYGGSKVEVPFHRSLNPNGPFSVEFWAKPRQKVNDSFCAVASINSDPAIGPSTNSDPRAGWLFYLTPNSFSGNEWQFRLGNANTSAEPNYLDGDAIRGGIAATGVWHHVVGTYDGSKATLYVNGQAVTSRSIVGYRANDARAFRIGTTCFEGILGPPGNFIGNRGFDGWLQEVAVYGTSLSAAEIAAHYTAGKTAGADYPALVLANQPIGYWRLGEPGDPTAPNLGTRGAEVDAQYAYGSRPGDPGPQPPAYSGFAADNHAPTFSGRQGFVEIPALNLNTNTVTLTAWIFAPEIQANNAAIVFCRAGRTVAGLKFDVNDPNGLSYNWNASSAAFNFKSGLTVPLMQWCFVALIVEPEQATLCLQEGNQFLTAVNYTAHPAQFFEGSTLIGADIQNPDLTFHGAMDEVAVFNRALSVGEVYSEYASAAGNLPLRIFAEPEPPAGPVYVGESLSLQVDVGGTPPLTYEWRKDGVPLSGASSGRYFKAAAQLGDSGDYEVVVSSARGSVTSQKVSITVQPVAPPAIIREPVGRSLFQGGSLVLNLEASGGGLAYQWQKNGTKVIGATNATYTVANASGGDSGTYEVLVSNSAGSAHSVATMVTVIVPADGTYEQVVVADAPEAWWRLDDPPGSLTLTDSLARHEGSYLGGVTLGEPGALIGHTNGAATFDGSSGYAEVPFSKDLNTANFTIECWVKGDPVAGALAPVASFTQPPGRGYLLLKSEDGHWQYIFGDGVDTAVLVLDGSDAIYDRWTYLVLTYDGNEYRGYLNGRLDVVASAPFTANNLAPLRIGFDQPAGGWNDHWSGSIDEVAYYSRALSPEQVAAHYAAALYPPNTKPMIIRQPESASAFFGTAFYFEAVAEGSAPLSVQWSQNGIPLAGETNFFLLRPSLVFGDTGVYQLTAINSAGQVTSHPVTLAVLPTPGFAFVTNDLVLHLAFDGDLLDSSGRANHGEASGSPAFVAGVIGKNAVHCTTTVDASDPNDPFVLEANYVSLGTPPDLQFGSDVNFSLSYWVRFTGTPGDLPFFCNAMNSYGNPGYTFAPSYGQGGWSWSLGDNESGSVIGAYSFEDFINDGRWHHLVHTFDRLGSARTYLDGYFVDTRSIVPLKDIDSGEPTNVGQDSTGTYPEAGDLDIDDLAVWRRVLTPFEVSAIYSAGQQGMSFDAYGPVSLVVTRDAQGIQLVWQAGTLLEADDVLGPWTPVAEATPPYLQLTPSAFHRFYRVQL